MQVFEKDLFTTLLNRNIHTLLLSFIYFLAVPTKKSNLKPEVVQILQIIVYTYKQLLLDITSGDIT